MAELLPLFRRIVFNVACFTAAALATSALAQQSGDVYFEQNCSSCHSIGAGFVAGPDLKDVASRANRSWLVEFIRDPEKKIAAKDPYVIKLQSEAQGMTMPAFPDFKGNTAQQVLDYIESRSGGGHPEPAAPTAQGDAGRGRALFTGRSQLSAGGAACIACHQAAGLPGTGGKLGPDLTQVLTRLGGERGLTAWLRRPPTPVMTSIYRNKQLNDQEVADLISYLSEALKSSEQVREEPRRVVQLTGVGVSLLTVLMVGLVWRDRTRGVRETIVRKRGGE